MIDLSNNGDKVDGVIEPKVSLVLPTGSTPQPPEPQPQPPEPQPQPQHTPTNHLLLKITPLAQPTQLPVCKWSVEKIKKIVRDEIKKTRLVVQENSEDERMDEEAIVERTCIAPTVSPTVAFNVPDTVISTTTPTVDSSYSSYTGWFPYSYYFAFI